MEKPLFPLKVFFDGGCIVCATEMAVYRKKDHDGLLVFIDIGSAGFDDVSCGFSRAELMEQLHAVDGTGRVFRGVDAFRAIWQAFPASTIYGLLGTFIALPGVNRCARFGYALFARYRKYLPRRKGTCESGLCSLGKRP